MAELVLKVHTNDNVIVALKDLQKGQTIRYKNEEFVLKDDVKAKHKFFTTDM